MKIQFLELAEALREGGLEKAAADMAQYLKESGIEVIRGRSKLDLDPVPDIVHFHGLWSPEHYRSSLLCRKHRIPVVVSPHGMLEPWAWKHRRWKKWPYFYLLEKRRLKRATAILTTAAEEAVNVKRFFNTTRVEVLPLGIEPDVKPDYEGARAALGWKPEERVLLYLSRVHPKKGLKELMEALMEVSTSARTDKVRLVIVGDGPTDYMDLCHGLAGQLRQHIAVDWIPPQWGKGKWKYLQGADLFCLPTYSENFGIVILEAGIVGTPVFTTTGTPWSCIQEAGFGWVVEPAVPNYTTVLREFLDTDRQELHSRRQAFAAWTAENYSWPNLIPRYVRFYQDILNMDSN